MADIKNIRTFYIIGLVFSKCVRISEETIDMCSMHTTAPTFGSMVTHTMCAQERSHIREDFVQLNSFTNNKKTKRYYINAEIMLSLIMCTICERRRSFC